MNERSWIIPAAVVVAVLFLCLCCLAIFGFGALGLFNYQVSGPEFSQPFPSIATEQAPTPMVIRPDDLNPTPAATQAPEVGSGDELDMPRPSTEDFSVFTETLSILENTIVPINDPAQLAEQLGGKADIPETVPAPAEPYQVGDQDSFWITNTDTNESSQVQATLQYVSDHLYFWVEDGVRFNSSDLKRLAETFENKIYPTNREFFGSEWTPGIDNDPHLYILYAKGLGSTIAGYFSSNDEYHPMAHEYSNAHEMFLLSADNVILDEEFAYSVLAHEFQHMIHWYGDRNEESWMNEGFSEMAAFLNGYDIGGTDYIYTLNPDIQLNYWPAGTGDSAPYYGSAFLFLNYFLDRFGEEATQKVVSEPANGMVSIDNVLAEIGATDPQTGETITADDVFSDWVLTSFLQDSNVADGRYVYSNYPNAPQAGLTENLTSCPIAPTTRDVHQYGADYIGIDCSGDYTLTFEGSVQVGVVPVDPYSGSYAFWSNQGDESNMTLTRSFDFTDQNGPLTLDFHTWYDLETDYDYLYLTASTDGGETWQILNTPSGTDYNPSGNSYGWAYNGQTNNWTEESVDLSQFAGQEVLLRFDYVTDAAVNGEGFLLDDVSIPETGYFTDFESDDGGWTADGFVRIQNVLPQTYRISLIKIGDGDTSVEKYSLSGDNKLEIPVSLGSGEQLVLVISGTTRFTRQTAPYRFSLEP